MPSGWPTSSSQPPRSGSVSTVDAEAHLARAQEPSLAPRLRPATARAPTTMPVIATIDRQRRERRPRPAGRAHPILQRNDRIFQFTKK